jgi:hypothetical protein
MFVKSEDLEKVRVSSLLSIAHHMVICVHNIVLMSDRVIFKLTWFSWAWFVGGVTHWIVWLLWAPSNGLGWLT